MKPSLLIAEPDNFSPAALRVLQEALDVTCAAITQDHLRDAMRRFDAIWIRLGLNITVFTPPSEFFRCRFIACPATGTDHIDKEACEAFNIEVISLKGETRFLQGVRATAEHTLALMLSLLRRVPWAYQSVMNGNWTRDRFCGSELHGKVVGIIGLGRVGYQVAQLLRAFGCTVLSVDKGGDGLSVVLQAADIISLHLPLNAETYHYLDAEKLAQMKPGAVLINTSRGAVIDEAAAAQALLSGHLAGIAVDVLEGEPDISDSPLVSLARSGMPVLITPHIGGKTHESCEKTEVFLAHKLVKAMENSPCHAA